MKMLSGCPEEYELDGNLFSFINPLTIIVWKGCGTQKNERALHIFFVEQSACNLLDLFLIRSRHDERSPWSSLEIRVLISAHCVVKLHHAFDTNILMTVQCAVISLFGSLLSKPVSLWYWVVHQGAIYSKIEISVK